jgi:hypothetical protein
MTMAAPGGDARQEFEVGVEPSGHAQVDTILDRLSDLADLPLSGHAEIYDDVHQRLRGVLAEPGAGSAPSSGERP